MGLGSNPSRPIFEGPAQADKAYPGGRPWPRVRALLFLLLLVAAPAAAHPEAEAAGLWQAQEGDGLVVAAGHRPEVLAARHQWVAFLQVAEADAVAGARAKVCVVSDLVCIIPPQEAIREGTEWSYDTATFAGADGRPYAWPGDSRLGVQWILTLADGRTVEFPRGLNLTEPACAGREVECFETNYLAFDVAGSPGRGAPLPGPAALLLGLAVAAAARRSLL